ncbi:fimbrial biogenesis outer membrane usher protein [Myxococcus sp. CA056]|uniref:fimbria/pilus outer membrane usher protein n=1 Tax=unclassified Myxococcus TaxID=2648731 RepID=UPI00157ACBD7|nr:MULTISPECIES: fimbria/pilus outer membrane usher protein [unclassified Myxococcus]NTX14977.1 fimbrial biogenesis outer membrane usher protein [Myxococcus sp. CA056]NTX35984.1 fimbrial biogenesis outer membrane usher protein [Myxococcus sp. CA033]
MSRFQKSAARGALALALACAFSLVPWRASSDEPERVVPIVVEFTLNGVPRGDVFPLVRGTDVLLPAATLEANGVDLTRLGARLERIEGQDYVSLQSLAPRGRFELDERTTSLHCELPSTAFVPTRIDLGTAPPEGYAVTGSPSGFINYAAHLRNTRLALFGEVGASVGRGLLTTQGRWSPGTTPLRGLTQLSVDFPEVMVRALAGEATGLGGVLGGGAVVAGLHVMRSFELNPYFVRNPVQDLAGDVTTPSTLEIYVNNRLVRRTELPPGPYRLENLTVPRGEGTARYVVRDAFGRVSEVDASYSLGAQLLSPGVADYHLSLGVERESPGTRSFDYGRPLLLGTFRMGVTPWLTPGVRLEISPDLLSTGAVQWFQLPLGELEVSQAVSRSERHTGVAAGAAWSVQGRWLGGSVFGRAMSARYAHSSLAPDTAHPLVESGGNLFVALGRRVSVGGQALVTRWRTRGWSTWLSASTSAQLTERTLISFSASRGQLLLGPSTLEGMVSLNAILDPRTTGSLGHIQNRGGGITSVDVSRGVPVEGGLGFQVQGQTGLHHQALGRVDYETNVGRASGGLEWRQGVLVAAAEVSGGLVALGGRVRPTRAVDQGYALVRVEGVEGIGVRLDNHLIGRTDSRGELMVTRLQSYGANRLSLTDEDLPLEVYLRTTQKLVAPWRRGGVVLDFQVDRVRAFRGRLVLADDTARRTPAHGELQVDVAGARVSSPVGRNGEFELVDLPAGKHTATVIYPGGRCAATLDVPSLAGEVIDLGTVRCVDEDAR